VYFAAGDVLTTQFEVTAFATAGARYPEHPAANASANAANTFHLVITPLSSDASYVSNDGVDYTLLPDDLEHSHSYGIAGFLNPIKMDALNTAQAGRTVPIIWRLTDDTGQPVSDPNIFAGVRSFTTACDGGVPVDPIEAYSSGASSLQYLGDGTWQFNWKTDKSFANTCRAVYVSLANGQTSGQAQFRFR
jgi:hypothetical protein